MQIPNFFCVVFLRWTHLHNTDSPPLLSGKMNTEHAEGRWSYLLLGMIPLQMVGVLDWGILSFFVYLITILSCNFYSQKNWIWDIVGFDKSQVLKESQITTGSIFLKSGIFFYNSFYKCHIKSHRFMNSIFVNHHLGILFLKVPCSTYP